ncbi:MAG: GMC family oxidoreductase [Proteobacteria bacterium]|nr:GMC family oxidoreductase [Pseudomonadota bacterium]
MKRIETEVVVVGSGAAGATIARELARSGIKVVLLEKGPDWEWPVGHWIAYAALYNIHRSKEGVIIRRGVCTGGSTVVYSGNAFNPPPGFMDDIGIDFGDELKEVRAELNVSLLPESLRKDWKGTPRLVESAGELGLDMKPQEKLVDMDKCVPGCEDCFIGCRRGAKWTTRPYIEEAKQYGAELFTRTEVERVEIEGGRATGVRARRLGRRLFVAADRVVLSAGGLATPIILHNSGIKNAGTHFFTDPMSVILGHSKNSSMRGEVSYAYASEDHIGKFIVGTVSASNVLAAQLPRNFGGSVRALLRYPGTMGMFVKLCDSAGGRIEPDGSISKPLTPDDNDRMDRGIELAKKIMIGAGVDPKSIINARNIGGHPGGTAGIGRVVDKNLRTEIDGLYVCDASILPKSPGVPLVLILVSLARWFSKSLMSQR